MAYSNFDDLEVLALANKQIATKMDKIESPTAGNILTVDGSGNPVDGGTSLSSINTQLADKASQAQVMRKLISCTIAAGENVAAITWTQDDAGNALALVEAGIRIFVPNNGETVGSTSNIYGRINGFTTQYASSNASDNVGVFDAGVSRALYGINETTLKTVGGRVIINNSYRYSDGTTRNYGNRFEAYIGTISNINLIYLLFAGIGISVFPVGTAIEIWGRTA